MQGYNRQDMVWGGVEREYFFAQINNQQKRHPCMIMTRECSFNSAVNIQTKVVALSI